MKHTFLFFLALLLVDSAFSQNPESAFNLDAELSSMVSIPNSLLPDDFSGSLNNSITQ